MANRAAIHNILRNFSKGVYWYRLSLSPVHTPTKVCNNAECHLMVQCQRIKGTVSEVTSEHHHGELNEGCY